ncbi:MAG: TetR/AcrR family transcriptional regulator [Defluviitaleaceae bacterium]|nr:TetR/AcrR family transcriptional regulator [Defluviitaleaceae bacterium]
MPRNKYPEETVNKILEASLRLFLEKGYEQTTVLDIIANLGGLTRGAFYHHFKSKEDVLLAIVKAKNNADNCFKKAKLADTQSGLERLRLALRFGLEANTESEHNERYTKMLIASLSSPRILAEHIKIMREEAVQMAEIIEEGMADGSIKKGNARVLAELFLLLVNIWAMPNVFPGTRDDFSAKIAMIGQIFGETGYGLVDDELGKLFVNTTINFQS